jgi:signal transduction histidine kinase
MPFKVTARMILELGAELIGSDGVAFYELIKNAFDAGSKHVEVDVVIRIEQAIQAKLYDAALRASIAGHREKTSLEFRDCRENAIKSVGDSAFRSDDAIASLNEAESWELLLEAIDKINFIEFTDYGSGMSLQHLEEVYLLLGTRERLKQKKEQTKQGRPILGEKGIGRLSAMRLGERLSVLTTTDADTHWNRLDINWREFSHDSDALLNSIDIEPKRGKKKAANEEPGTRILISGLRRHWTPKALKEIARDEISRFMDPFLKSTLFPISIHYNDELIQIPRFEKTLFDHAHAEVSFSFDCGKREVTFSGNVNYLLRQREHTFSLANDDLASITEIDLDVLRKLGSFSGKLYWYNRQILTAIEGIGDRKRVLELVNMWSGGLMVFRDGFRVLPYGSPDDDWLDLDRKALASGGYKVNRKQIIGKVDISSRGNPSFTDQTNREGLRDCTEKQALLALLRHLFEVQFRAFLNRVDKQVNASIEATFDDIKDRMTTAAKRMKNSVRKLVRDHPDVKEDKPLLKELRESTQHISTLIRQTEELAESFESGRSEMVHLAGIGAMVEFVAHELNRATERALETLSSRQLKTLSDSQRPLVGTLRSQLTTLQKRLRILDPLSTPGRQVKESFNLVDWVKEIAESHEGQFERHGIQCLIESVPPRKALDVRMVKGMVVQIIENLISNSVYWLKQRSKLRKNFRPEISIRISLPDKQIRFADNGPGINPDRREEVFQAFVTTKPPGQGKGLGLFISREIAIYHDALLYLSEEDFNSEGKLNTFVLDLEKA